MAESYRDLIAWQKGMALVARVYRVTDQFPRQEIYGLTRQVRDAAVSIPSNIAEGKGRKTKKDYAQFLYRARGSVLEVLTQLEAVRNLEFLDPDTFQDVFAQGEEVGRVLSGLISSVERQIAASPKS